MRSRMLFPAPYLADSDNLEYSTLFKSSAAKKKPQRTKHCYQNSTFEKSSSTFLVGNENPHSYTNQDCADSNSDNN